MEAMAWISGIAAFFVLMVMILDLNGRVNQLEKRGSPQDDKEK